MSSSGHDPMVSETLYSITAGRTESPALPKGVAEMRKGAFVLAAIVMLGCLAIANAADLSGKWKGELQSPNGPLEINFDFHVDGEKLIGTVANTYGTEQITDGIVKGDAISFVIMAGGGVETQVSDSAESVT